MSKHCSALARLFLVFDRDASPENTERPFKRKNRFLRTRRARLSHFTQEP
ncbi:MAG: hypothetical protein J6K25_10135 [Thermoguttaceae bacterium]|nr:hypothetical protein [Thermoguttaceae bacterium]